MKIFRKILALFKKSDRAEAERLWEDLRSRTPFPLTPDQREAFIASHLRRKK